MALNPSLVRAFVAGGRCSRCRRIEELRQRISTRTLSSSSSRAAAGEGTNIAAPEIDFTRQPAIDTTRARIVPASASYFTSQPAFTDNLVRLQALVARYRDLPVLAPSAAPRVTWQTLMQYRTTVGENVRVSRYARIRRLLQRLNLIHPALRPPPVADAIQHHRRALDPLAMQRRPQVLDEFGRAYANGRRKSSRANVYLVEGEGQVVVNGRSIAQHFGRVHDRESALWPLKVTARLDKYNVWATAHGGGTTGQAESITHALAKALLIHEPGLKPALRKGGVVTRDPRKVERKKPGHVKARKMPAWVKR